MDTPENSDQLMQKLSGIESQLRSLRYVFGIGIIIMAVFLALLAPTLVQDYSDQNGWEAPSAMNSGYETMPVAEAPSAPVAPPAATTTAATTTTP